MAWTLEELKAERERRKASPTDAPTATTQKPSGGPAAGTSTETDLVDVVQELGSSYARNVLEKSEDNLNMFSAPPRFLLNKALEVAGSDRRVPEFDITSLTDEALSGGQVADPSLRESLQGAGETATDAIEMGTYLAGGAGLTRATGRALARGAGKVLGKGANAATSARGAAGAAAKPRVRVRAGEQAQMPPRPPRRGFKETMKDMGAGAATGATLGGATGQDPLKSAVMGAAINNPLGRMAMSRVAGRVLGDAGRVGTYVGLHPSTRRAATRLKKALADRLKEGK
jgi:hypothetical protein